MNSRRGFTLIELIFTISLIGILASFVVLALGSARAKGRDARRKHDLAELKNGLESYAADQKPNHYYVASSVVTINGTTDELSTALLNGYAKTIPHDPLNKTIYIYKYASFGGGANYQLTATLENKNDPTGNNGVADGYVVTNQ